MASSRSNRLERKVAIVTGASNGIGRAISLKLASEGASVVCGDLQAATTNSDESVPTHELIQSQGGQAIFVNVDVSQSDMVKSLVQAAVDTYGMLHIMVNNAGIAPEPAVGELRKGIWEASEEMYEEIQQVNAKGVFLGTKWASAQMIQQKPVHVNGDRGWIINTASTLGLVGSYGLAGYCASKHAVVGLTRSAALDLARYRIHCNAIAPGDTETPMTAAEFRDVARMKEMQEAHPFRGAGTAGDIANAIVFLASEDCSWMTGAIVPVDGGYTCK